MVMKNKKTKLDRDLERREKINNLLRHHHKSSGNSDADKIISEVKISDINKFDIKY